MSTNSLISLRVLILLIQGDVAVQLSSVQRSLQALERTVVVCTLAVARCSFFPLSTSLEIRIIHVVELATLVISHCQLKSTEINFCSSCV